MRSILLYSLALLTFLFADVRANAQSPKSKSPLKILFVGYDPSQPMPQLKWYPGSMSKELFAKEYPVRFPAFKTLLSQYFTEVKTVDCRDWKPEDSESYDVTVFDFPPMPLKDQPAPDNPGRKAKILPDDFSKPVVFIASTASDMGNAIGLKLDWLCLCLDADAHHMNLKHPIFNGPLEKVTPSLVMKKTPDGIYHYASGANVPKQLPMWRVQNTSYEKEGARIGLVSRGNRFTEGPDAEVISSGYCQKDVGAVALGRHGNFFLWGFGSSPADMTEEAKKVFVNVVAYMKQFDGKIPITRKYYETMATTPDIMETASSVTPGRFEELKRSIIEFNEDNAKALKAITAKQQTGQKLTSTEEETLEYAGTAAPIPTWEDYLKRQMGPYAGKFGTDAAGFRKYLLDNLGYIYCNPKGFYEYTIDEEAKTIGVSNHSLKFLEKCIAMLKKGDRPELALNLLRKYTTEKFTTAEEWNNWYLKNKRKLFFSETNNYGFMINTYN